MIYGNRMLAQPTASVSEESEPTTAEPPRFRWLKRGAVAMVIAIVALVGLRLWWGHLADHRLRQMADTPARIRGIDRC